MKKRHLLVGAVLAVLAVVGCGSGGSTNTGSFAGGTSGSNNAQGARPRVVLNFDSLPPGVDSVEAVFLDENGRPLGEPIKVPANGQDFFIDNFPANFASVEIDYLRNNGYALFESFHQRGTKTYISRVEASDTNAPQLHAAPPQRTKWSTSLGPAAFHVEASGNPGSDRPAQNEVFKVRGVGYSPAPIGTSNKDGPGFGDYFWDGYYIQGAGDLLDYSKVWKRDLENIRPRFNAVRCYSMIAEHVNSNGQWENPPIVRNHKKFLDACWNNGNKPVYVLVGIPLPSDCFFAAHDPAVRANFERVLASTLAQTKDHPAVMGYTFFNEQGGVDEWGGNTASSDYYWTQVQKYSQQIKAGAPDKLCGFAYFDAPSNVSTANAAGYLKQYGGSLDYWGVNSFQGTTTVGALASYKALTDAKKPVLFTEFSVPATGHRDKTIASGASPTQASVNSIYADSQTIHLAAQAMTNVLPGTLTDDVVAGMLYFEWCDEWWKQDSKEPFYTTTKEAQQGGQAADLSQMPNGFNDEEGFGLHSIELGNRPVGAIYHPFDTGAATSNNRPDVLTPRTELLEAVTNAFKPIR